MGLTNPTHLLVLVVIIALVFGSSKVSGMARSAGKHAREAKDGVDSFKQAIDIGDGNPLTDVVDTVRSANPKTIVKNAAKNAASPTEPAKVPPAEAATPAEGPKVPPKTAQGSADG